MTSSSSSSPSPDSSLAHSAASASASSFTPFIHPQLHLHRWLVNATSHRALLLERLGSGCIADDGAALLAAVRACTEPGIDTVTISIDCVDDDSTCIVINAPTRAASPSFFESLARRRVRWLVATNAGHTLGFVECARALLDARNTYNASSSPLTALQLLAPECVCARLTAEVTSACPSSRVVVSPLVDDILLGGGCLHCHELAGAPATSEFVFAHTPSHTLLVTDMFYGRVPVSNVPDDASAHAVLLSPFTLLWFRAWHFTNGAGVPPYARARISDRPAFERSLARLPADITRIVCAHGALVTRTHDARALMQRAWRQLLDGGVGIVRDEEDRSAD